ncbi:MAG: MogA/MoaB family molybdenum cofactor biosynthesis protein [Nitriliruptoraceae bacterium]
MPEHKTAAPPFSAAVITASDGAASGHRDDTSGGDVESMLTDAGFTVQYREVVPDERERIAERLRTLSDIVALVVVTGGTGFGPRDVTPEAAADVIERQAPGLAEAMRATGRASTPLADLSRAVCGARGTSLIVTLPGSPRGATESLGAIIDLLPHALRLLAGDTAHHPPM